MYFLYPLLFLLQAAITSVIKWYLPSMRRWKSIRSLHWITECTTEDIRSHASTFQRRRRWGLYQGQQRQGGIFRHAVLGAAITIMAFTAILAFAAPTKKAAEHQAQFDTDSTLIGVDNRCSVCISGYLDDFQEHPKPTDKIIRGFNQVHTTGVMEGTIKYKWEDDNGLSHEFTIPNSIYVPTARVRLLSPQHWAQHYKRHHRLQGRNDHIAEEMTDDATCVLRWGPSSKPFTRTIPLDRNTRVATFPSSYGYHAYMAFSREHGIIDDHWDDNELMCYDVGIVSDDEDSVVTLAEDDGNDHDNTWVDEEPLHQEGDKQKTKRLPDHFSEFNVDVHSSTNPKVFDVTAPPSKGTQQPSIIPDEEERQPMTATARLLQAHYDFGHVSFRKLQRAAKKGILPAQLKNCPVPTCSACAYARATRRPWRGKQKKSHAIRKATAPGQVVGVDQLVSPVPGLIGVMTGFQTTKRYRYATVFVDHYSGLGYVYLQKTATAEETLLAKKAFERYALSKGITVYHYHADNGVFKANKWVEAVQHQGQGLTFAAVGAHHQNGMAERRIRELQETARAMLLHAHRRWPKAITPNLWPYALQEANDSYNNLPSMKDEKGRSPLQLFAPNTAEINPKHHKPFGSPVFVLNSKLQAGQPFNKWSKRARVGIYLGRSPLHARNVALVLDRDTGYVSPQFHVQFDKNFHTSKQLNMSANWVDTLGFGKYKQDNDDKSQKSKRNKIKVTKSPRSSSKRQRTTVGNDEGSERQSQQSSNEEMHQHAPIQIDARPVNTEPEGAAITSDETRGRESNVHNAERRNPTEMALSVPRNEAETTETQTPPEYLRPTRSGRVPKPNRDYYAKITELLQKETAQSDVGGEIFCYENLFPQDDSLNLMDAFMEYKMIESDKPAVPLYAMKAAQSDPDTMYYHQAMKEPDSEEFKAAMIKEVTSQIEEGIYSLVPRNEVPEGAKVYPAVWQMKRKRHILTREVKKHKARCNLDGSRMQKGIDFNFSYSAVASWTVIRIVMAMAVSLSWHTRQIDYVLAFPQAPIDNELYMEIPRGVQIGDTNTRTHVLKLHKNIYGTKFASRTWNKYLTNKLVNDVGFTQSKYDECLFYKGNVVYILYTDDSILAGPDEDEIDQVISLIKEAGLKITDEGDIQDFLGVNIQRKGKTVEFTQPQLIEKVLRALRFKVPGDDESTGLITKSKDTPAATSRVLLRHDGSKPHDESFNYRSVIGMLGYLTRCTRSDIAYAVHQCARFAANPKIEHTNAIRWLGRYLLGTMNKGMHYVPDMNQGLEVFVDADFAGTWDPKDTESKDTARSRYGYIVRLFGCPILWKSALQTEIALSTTEAEYTGLSHALRDVIPIMNILKEMKEKNLPVVRSTADIHCRVFEDNSGAVEIAREHKYRPRTKHLNCKLHHFRGYVDSGEISIHPISTTEQPADYLTKSLPYELFEKLRRIIMGW
mmetsp:Transcript_26540/g.37655  ORF Transcript_26540/g.37655 Transcript_26540/m.37655 type:complete len:1449 (-) Transcript_26540:1524-5870(-)